MKKCTVCLVEKDVQQFQKRVASHDGLTSACKLCLKDRDSKKYLKRYDAVRSKQKIYSQTKKGKAISAKAKKEWQNRNLIKRAAHILVGNYVRDGKLRKQPCCMCGETMVHAHHDDYSKPLDVMWLCAAHHKARHVYLKNIFVESPF